MNYRNMNTDKKTCLDIFHMSITSIAFCVRAWKDGANNTQYEECLLFNDMSNLIAPASCWMLALKAGVVSASSDIVNATLYTVDVSDACGEVATTWGGGCCMAKAIKALLLAQCSTHEHDPIHWELKRKHFLLSKNVLQRYLP